MTSPIEETFDKDSLGKLKAFADFNPSEVETLAALSDRARFAAGATVFEEGSVGDSMFIILEGNVQVVRGSVEFAALSVGDFFGELALVDPAPRSASVVAKTDCEFLVVAQTTVGVLAGTSPRAALKLLVAVGRELAIRLRKGNQKYFDLVLGCADDASA